MKKLPSAVKFPIGRKLLASLLDKTYKLKRNITESGL